MESKTIIINYDDISRMKEFCTQEEGVITKEFMDWYVLENSFFMTNGVLIIENIYEEANKKLIIYFDFSDPDFPEFSAMDNTSEREVIRWSFSRAANLTMKDVVVNLQYWDKDYIKKRSPEKTYLITESLNKKLTQFKARIPVRVRMANASTKKLYSEKNKLTKELNGFSVEIIRSMAEASVYIIYSTMFYFSRNKSKEVVGAGRSEILTSGIAQLVNSNYKYTGFVNLNESKIYRPVIKKDKNEPIREYGRHIEKWYVRGHYRRVGDKTIWIEPHTKGSGNLEQRHYGTDNLQEAEIIPKIIPIQKIVYKEVADSEVLAYSRPEQPPPTPPPSENPYIRPSLFRRISSYFTSLFR